MPKFRKRPVVIEAVQFTGDNFDEIVEFAQGGRVNELIISDDPHLKWQVFDRLHSTWVNFGDGDWIIRGLQGEYYPCVDEVFTASYEPVAAPEVNHGPLPDGGFWAGFCSNPECNVLGCPGDCQATADA